MTQGKTTDTSLVYPVAVRYLTLALLPVFIFGLEAMITQFNKDEGLISNIAFYYERHLSDTADLGVILILEKLTVLS